MLIQLYCAIKGLEKIIVIRRTSAVRLCWGLLHLHDFRLSAKMVLRATVIMWSLSVQNEDILHSMLLEKMLINGHYNLLFSL